MAKDAGDLIGNALGTIAREIGQSVSSNGHEGPFDEIFEALRKRSDGLGGARGVAAGAALAAAAPLAGKVMRKFDASGIAKTVGEMIPSGEGNSDSDDGDGNDEGGEKGASGVGKGRRMPVQQAVDIAVPVSVAYNQWTQFEEWPEFMHRLDQATQEDECTVSFRTKVWGMSKEFVAEIAEQRPDERIQWSVKQGVVHNGVVTFHELGPRLTRVQVSLDLEPGSWLEKAARGMRFVKRAVRGDMARFKAFIEMQETETGAWRGEIHDGEVAKKTASRQSSKSSSSSTKRKPAKRKRSGGGQRKKARSRS